MSDQKPNTILLIMWGSGIGMVLTALGLICALAIRV